jgi:hypothetical protein
MAPSQSALAVAGVQNPSRQQCSLVPFFQIRAPSPFFQLSWLEGAPMACAAAEAAMGAASTADAKSIATLFSFFIESPLEESRRDCKTSKSEARKPGKHPV